ncbi:MAG: hypothetical protein AAF196_12550 [Planctomycetota bacterium]
MPAPQGPSGGGISAPKTAAPGDRITIDVASGATEITILIPGRPPELHPVGPDGLVEFRIPSDATPGGVVLISDMKAGNPSSTTIDIESS